MQLQAGESALAFAVRFAAMAWEAEVKGDRAAQKLAAAMQQHAPDLSSMRENDMIMRGSASPADIVCLANNYSRCHVWVS